jgi:hypothetical protein
VRGGSFIGRGREDARGILKGGENITHEVKGVTVLGENSSSNLGLSNTGAPARFTHLRSADKVFDRIRGVLISAFPTRLA